MFLSTKSVPILVLSIAITLAGAQQQQIDPAFLRDYYAQISQQNTRGEAGSSATPIYEQESGQSQPQYISPGQQIRDRDPVAEQIRVQQPSQFVAPAVRQQYLNQQQQLQYQPQYQQQNIVYSRPQTPAKQTLTLTRKPQFQQQQQQQQYQDIQQGPRPNNEEEDDNGANSSYQFGFDVKDDEYTNYQNRKEVRDGNVIKGSYSVVDSDGFIRTVTYTADPKEGFKADVVREPTDIVVKIPTPAPENLLRGQQQPQTHFLTQGDTQYRQLPRQQQLRHQQ